MTNPQNIDAIIAELSEAQRVSLISARASYPENIYRVLGHGVTRKALRARGLGHGDFCYLTPLGLAVRSALIGEVGRDG
jgi:hypothetical protein